MNRKTIIALILSLFVFPGMGHVYLGFKKKGYLISLIICIILFAMIMIFEWELLEQANRISDPNMVFSSLLVLAGKAWFAHRMIYIVGIIITGFIWLYAAWDIFQAKKQLNK